MDFIINERQISKRELLKQIEAALDQFTKSEMLTYVGVRIHPLMAQKKPFSIIDAMVEKANEKKKGLPINLILQIEKLIDSIHLTTHPSEAKTDQQEHPGNEGLIAIDQMRETILKNILLALDDPKIPALLESHFQNTLSQIHLQCKQCGAVLK
jgi:hypothetical protein